MVCRGTRNCKTLPENWKEGRVFFELARMQARGPLFDAHCHLQDARIAHCTPRLLQSAKEAGVQWFAVNGTSQEDWEDVKQLGEKHPSVIPCFGLHPWYLEKRSPDWLSSLRAMLEADPTAALGEAGLDRSPRGSASDEATQASILRQQLELARELHRPAAIHCVRAFGPLQEVLRDLGPFSPGLILHSYSGSAEMVRALSNHNTYFSFSGFITGMKPNKAKNILKAVPWDRLLLETDSPDALPNVDPNSLAPIPDPPADSNTVVKSLNHPSNIRSVLSIVSSHLGKTEEEVGAATYQNAIRLFSFPGSKLLS